MISSSQRRKQRKFAYTRPMHERKACVHVHLSKELKKKLNTRKRAIAVREGDKVKVIKGDYASKEARVAKVDLSDGRIYLEGIVARTARGTEKLKSIAPASVILLDGNFTDKARKAIIER